MSKTKVTKPKAKLVGVVCKTTNRKQKEIDPVVAARLRADDIRHRAKRWAELHADPKTRAKMDMLLNGLSPNEARAVILNGQRIACGLQPKDYT